MKLLTDLIQMAMGEVMVIFTCFSEKLLFTNLAFIDRFITIEELQLALKEQKIGDEKTINDIISEFGAHEVSRSVSVCNIQDII